MRRTWIAAAALAAALAGCGSDGGQRNWPTSSEPGAVPAFEQRDGDPQAGYDAIVNRGIVRCGIPYSAYEQVFDPAPASERLPGRTGLNTDLPYIYTATKTESGVDIVSANCLTCHAAYLDGKLVIGLGNTTSDFTQDQAGLAVLARAFVSDPTERDELEKFIDRMVTVSPYTTLTTRGVNPADNLAAILFAHRDRDTLAWSYQPLMEEPPMVGVPVDVPPWWRMRDKHAMFYVGAGRGDHSRHMMAASSLCTDTLAEARDIDTMMPDVAAYVRSLEPPAFTGTVDQTLADQGEQLFADNCARCHGTYGAGGDYPNLIIAADEVGTDDTLAVDAAFFAGRFVDWYNNSFFGEYGWLAPAPGYYAPSLRGIWATAPYLHNGSVPDMVTLLDSSQRPTYWTRNFDAGWDYDLDRLGWRYTALDTGKDGAADPTTVYDTTQPGYGNGGHTYGDALSTGDRAALIEYLKTL